MRSWIRTIEAKAGPARLRRLLAGGVIGSLMILFTLASSREPAAAVTSDSPVLPGICRPSDRFGLSTTGGQILEYDVGKLHAGWYHNFWILEGAPRPADMTYVQTIRLAKGPAEGDRACSLCPGRSCCPTWSELSNMVQASPGAIWLIGNEPDTIASKQDNIPPLRYAELYKQFYDFLKEHDLSCLVGIAGVVQPTPIRLQYLTMILDAYQAQNGEPMPIDVWNTHNYLLREKRYGLPDSWGAGIPPGIDADEGILYDIPDGDLLDPCVPQQPPDPDDPHCADKIGWKQQLIDLRQFMKAKGYQDRPLVISEYGILMPLDYGFDYVTVKAFMLATFEWLRDTTDPDIGYPADGNHLVQAWNWYPFDIDVFGGMPGNAHLFDPALHTLTPVGTAFGDYTEPLTDAYPGTVDLRTVSVMDGPPISGANGLVDVTITADILNAGASPSGSAVVRFDYGAQAREIGVQDVGPGEVRAVQDTWLGQLGDWIDVHVTATATQAIDCDPYNNDLSAHLWVTEHTFYLPVVGRAPNH